MRLNKRQLDILAYLHRSGGEGIKGDDKYYSFGSRMCAAEVVEIDELARLGCIKIEDVGQSRFCVLTEMAMRELQAICSK